MAERKRARIPSGASVLAWLGVIGTILGIVGFFIDDLPSLFGGETQAQGLTDEQIVATLAAMQNGKESAELQLTQIAIDNQLAANQSTQQAIAEREANMQGTIQVVQLEQENFLATQNALGAANATADAIVAANATATAFVATETVLNATATAQFLANITPTPTPLPTSTPLPTATVIPEQVSDYRSLISAVVAVSGNGRLQFATQAAQVLPETPPEGLAYVWSIDTDRNPATGLQVQDIGVDVRVTAKFENDTWVGTVRTVDADGPLGEAFFFADIKVKDDTMLATLSPAEVGLPSAFDWVARVELGGQSYSFFPVEGHSTVSG